MAISPEHLIPFFEEEDDRCIHLTTSAPLQIEHTPIHTTFLSHSPIVKNGSVDMVCICEVNQVHIWLAQQYTDTIVCDDAVLSVQPYFETELGISTIFIASGKSVHWYVYRDEWRVAWSYPTTQPALSTLPSFDTVDKTYCVSLLFSDSLLRIANILIEVQEGVTFNTENANFNTFKLNFMTENVNLLFTSYLEDSLLICTTTTWSLYKVSNVDQSISYKPVGASTAIKDCIFVRERNLAILLTQNGTIEFIDSRTLTLSDEWSSERIYAIALLAEEDEHFLVCQRTDELNSYFDVISLRTLEIVASHTDTIEYVCSLIRSQSISDKFTFYTRDEANVLQLHFCNLSYVTNKADLERTRVDFSQLQVCLDKGFDWVTEIIDNIHGSQFQTACYLWWKHSDSIQLELTSSIFSLLLNKIAVTNNIDGILLWLESLILFITLQGSNKQAYLSQFLDWIEAFIENLEKHFPENWIQLALRLTNFLCTEISAIDSWETSRQLVIIKNQIEDIQIVFSTLNIRLSFSRISEYSLSSFLHQLLRHAHSPDQIRSLLTSKIISIINRHGESLDNVLYKYIQSLSGKFRQEAYLAELLESKAITVVQHINSNDLKHKSVLFLLRHARLPLNKKLLEFSHEVENTTRISMNYEIQLAELLSILKEHSIDTNGILFSPHQLTATVQSILASGQSTHLPRSLESVARYSNISDDTFSYFLNSAQMLSNNSILDEDSHFEPFHLIPSILIALISEEYFSIETCSILEHLTKLRPSISSTDIISTNKNDFYLSYFEKLFKSVFLFLNLPQLESELTIPQLLESPPPISAYSGVISTLPSVLERDPELASPSKRVKLTADSKPFLANFYQLHRSHRQEIYIDLINSAVESLDIKSAILLVHLRITNEGLFEGDDVSRFVTRILSKFSVKLSSIYEPIKMLNQLEDLAYICSIAMPRGLIYFTYLLMRIKLIKDVICQSEYEIKPRHSKQQQKEYRKLSRNHFYQEKGFILDKNSAGNCIASLSTRDNSLSPGLKDTATALLTLKNSFLPQISLSFLLHSLYSTPSLTISPTLHNIPASVLTSTLRNSPLDVTYTLALILSLHEEESQRELSICSKKITSSLSWFSSIAWIGLWYQELVRLTSFKAYALNAISTAQYMALIRSVTRQNIEVQSNQWTSAFILKKLCSPFFSPIHILRAAQVFGMDEDKELLLWVRTAIQLKWDTHLIRQGLSLIEKRFESLQCLYESGEVSNYQGIKFILESLTQLEKPPKSQPMLYKAICLATFLISSNAPFLSKSAPTADTTADTELNTSLLTSDHLTFNDLLGENPWSLIKDFLSFQYIDIYLGLTAYLDIERDHIISNTIKAEVVNHSPSKPISIQEVRPYLERLGTREIQIAASKWLGSNMQHIEDKMGAIFYAIQSAEQWKMETSVVTEIQKASEARDRLQTYYNMLKVNLWLEELGLSETDSSQLHQAPRELIGVVTSSYQPETIYQCTKLYGIIMDICSLFSLDIDTVISDSISSLISNQREIKNLNSSFSFCIEGDVEDTMESLDITSNVYTQLIVLLSSHSLDIDLHVNNLVNISTRDSKTHSYSNRKAAIQLAIILISHYSHRAIRFNKIVLDTLAQAQSQFSTSEREAGGNHGDCLRMLLDLLCIVEDLELLGYPMGIGTFLQSNKHAVIQGLVRNFTDSFQAFELAARIGILLLTELSESLWEEILVNLNKYRRFAFLLSQLPKLRKCLSQSFLKPLHFSVLTQIELSEHLSLFPQFIQLAHGITDFSTSDRQVFITTISKSIDCLKRIDKASYAQILEHLIQSLNTP